jgi:hypothetical protein
MNPFTENMSPPAKTQEPQPRVNTVRLFHSSKQNRSILVGFSLDKLPEVDS